MFREGERLDRGAHYALAVASLKRKGEDIQQQLDALRLAEANLLQAARDEAKDKIAAQAALAEPRPDRDPKQARKWGIALSESAARQAREAAAAVADQVPPHAPTELALEAQEQVAEALEVHRKAQAEVREQQAAQAEQVLMMQAEAVAQQQALAEAQAQALSDAQAQAELVSEMQQQLQVEVQQAAQAQEVLEAAAAERHALRAQGLNSKKLPLRPGVPPCGYFMRKGECKYGKACKWDHPEVTANSKGYPRRPGETQCAFYTRTGVCKFGMACRFDHPEGLEPPPGSALPDDVGAQLQALTQVLAQAATAQAAATAAVIAPPPQLATPLGGGMDQEAQKQLLALLGGMAAGGGSQDLDAMFLALAQQSALTAALKPCAL